MLKQIRHQLNTGVSVHLYITGFMAVGKTTLGKKLATALAMPFIDTDKLVVQQTKKSIEEIFEQDGEETFRKLEADALRSIKDDEPAVVATGGGLPCYYDNMAFMNEHGFTVYLSAESSFIYSRLVKAKKPRPLVKSLTPEELMEFIQHKLTLRQPCYMQSHLHIEVPVKSSETLVRSIVEAYTQHPGRM